MIAGLKRASGRSAIVRILTGSLLGQGIFLAVSPLLTRMYSPVDFSALALITAFVAVLSSLATLSWERAVVLPSTESDASAVVWLGLFSTAGLSFVFGALGFLFRDQLTILFGSSIFSTYWWIIPGTTFVVGVYAVLSSWVVRIQQYGILAVRNAVVGIGQAGASVGLGALGLIPLGLLLSLGIGRLISLPGLIAGTQGFRERPPPLSDIRRQALRYRKFPLITSWSRALNSLGLQLPLIMLIAIFGSYEAGFVALTMRVLAAPIGIVVDAVSQYFEGVFSARVRLQEPGLTSLVLSVSRGLALVGMVPALAVLVCAPSLFGFVFGSEWMEAGVIAQILVPAYWLQFSVVPTSRALLILECQGTQLVWDFLRAAFTAIAVLVVFEAGGGLTAAVTAFAITLSLSYCALFGLVCLKSRHLDREWLTKDISAEGDQRNAGR